VCLTNFGPVDAAAACRSLGYSGISAIAFTVPASTHEFLVGNLGCHPSTADASFCPWIESPQRCDHDVSEVGVDCTIGSTRSVTSSSAFYRSIAPVTHRKRTVNTIWGHRRVYCSSVKTLRPRGGQSAMKASRPLLRSRPADNFLVLGGSSAVSLQHQYWGISKSLCNSFSAAEPSSTP
jgi:hypothetical protein